MAGIKAASTARFEREPADDDPLIIDVGNFGGIEIQAGRQAGQIGQKPFVEPYNAIGAINFSARNICQPIASFANGKQRIALVLMDIHAGQIGYKTLITILLDVEDQHPLVLLCVISKPLGTQKYPKFQRHVKARQLVLVVKFGP